MHRLIAPTLVLAFLLGLAPPPATGDDALPDYVAQALAAPDRAEADRALDAGRRPGETLAFFGIAPGMRVAELGAGGGYTTELLARTVGSDGAVYGQNNAFVLKRFAEEPWSKRLAKPVMASVTRLDREFDHPFPADLKDLDVVVNVLFYHDTVWQKVDRDAMNTAVFKALKPGGVYGIVDHRARSTDGLAVTKTLHRITEQAVRADIERAGFELAATADFLANPDDSMDWNAAPSAAGDRRGTSDRFVLKFVKPVAR